MPAKTQSEFMEFELRQGRARCACCNVVIKIKGPRFYFTRRQNNWAVWCGKCYKDCRPFPWHKLCVKIRANIQ